MTIKVTYNVTDIYVSETVSATYINVSYETPTGGGGVWGDITGTLSNQTDLQNALDLKVPYTGATADVDLGEFEMKAGQVEFDQTPTGTAGVGVMRWNDSDGTVDLGLKGGNVTLQVGQEQILRVVNKTGADLLESQYRAVRIRLASEGGTQGQRLAVVLAQGNNDANSADTIGIVTETITNNQEGFICTSGLVRDINTTGSLQSETWADGDIIYLSPTIAGAITNIKPTAPNHSVILGYVVYAHNVNGKIFVKCDNGYELGELHDVNTTGATNGQVLKYNGTIWTPSADSGITTLTTTGTSGASTLVGTTLNIPQYQGVLTNPITGTGTSGQVAYFTGATTQAGSNNLFWDNTNGRLGIGTNVPSGVLDVEKNYDGNTLLFIRNTGVSSNARVQLQINLESNTNNLSIGVRNRNGLAYKFLNAGDGFIQKSVSSGSGVDTDLALLADNTTSNIKFGAGGSSTAQMTLHSSGNLLLGSTTNSGQRLQVTGDTLLKGSGNTSGTVALTVQNSDGSDMLRVRSDQKLLIGTASTTAAPVIYAFSGITGARSLRIGIQSANSLTPTPSFNINQENDYTYTSGTGEFTTITANFLPTSGTGTLASLVLRNTINQTGGANGITRGLYVNPTLTAAADWRSIETSNNTGWAVYTAGTASSFFGGNVTIKGSGNTSATTALLIQDSIGNALFSVRNDNVINIGLRPAVSIYPAAFGAVQNITGRGIAMSFIASDTAYEPLTLTHGNLTSTANGYIVFNTIGTFNPTSGTATYTANRIGSTINQTGGANGITRGLYVNPTLTAAADWRSIEWSNNTGWGLYGAGTSNNFLNGNLGIGTTTPSRKQEIFTATSGSTVSLLKLKNQGAGDSGAAIDFDFFATDGVGARIAGIRTGAASFQSALVFYTNQGSTNVNIAESARFTYLQNFLIGSTTDSGEKLQVNGTAKITGATSFGGNMSLTLNQNASTKINVTNTTSDTNAYSTFIATSNGSGLVEFGKYSQLKTTYKILASGDGFIYNGVYGDISILNDNATGSIKFAAGGSSTAQMTLTSVGSLGIGATSVNASAITQIDSTTKGFLPPRMTTVQKLAIATPAAGLMVYDTTLNQMSYYNATIWINF